MTGDKALHSPGSSGQALTLPTEARLAEFERSIIRERTRAGLEAARLGADRQGTLRS